MELIEFLLAFVQPEQVVAIRRNGINGTFGAARTLFDTLDGESLSAEVDNVSADVNGKLVINVYAPDDD